MPFGISLDFISFGYPLALFLLLLLPIVYIMARLGAGRAMLRRNNRRLSIALRLLMVTFLVLAIADMQYVTKSEKLATVFLIDSSDSVGAAGKTQEQQFVRDAMAKMKDNQESGVVVFGQDAVIEKLVNKEKSLVSLSSAPLSNYTNLAEAVRVGSSLLPSDAQRRIVLLSDGNQNVDEVRNAAKIAAANGVVIDVVPVTRSDGPEASVGTINVPSTLRQGEDFNLSVSVDSNYEGSGRLVILQQGNVVSDTQVQLKKGTNTFNQPLKASSNGFVNYSARIYPEKDTVEQNNEANAYSVVKGKPKVLLINGHPEEKETASLETALKAAEIDTVTVTPDRFPALTELAQYESVVLVNTPANLLSEANMNILQAYVKDLGKGLVTVGGNESYGLGGYFRTPLEEMLPVELQLPNKLQTPSVAMVMVIDRSGSMSDSYNGAGAGAAGIPKIELAKDSALLAAKQLSNTDQVGVVTFDTVARWDVPLAPMGNPANLVSPIGRIAPGGGTQISSGYAPAIEALKNVQAKNKHIILMTDGIDSESANYDKLNAEAKAAGITVSTVGLGEDVNTNLLKSIADANQGRYYFVNDPGNLPKVFAKESHLAARNYIVEETFTPAVTSPSPILKGLSGLPQLKGYVGTKARPLATTALVSDRGDPILAHWQSGLGRVVSWTSDAKSKWAANWLSWPDFPRFWAQTVRWTIAENDASGLQVTTKTEGNRVVISADALTVDSQYRNGLETKAKIVNSSLNGSVEEVTLIQTAPGHYEGSFISKGPGSYLITVQGQGGTGQAANAGPLTSTIGAVSSYSPEYKQLGTNEALLKEVADLTGGKVLTKPEQAFTDDLTRTTRSVPLWPWLLLLAILLFPLDIGVRRINLSLKSIRQGFNNRNNPAYAEAVSSPAVGRLFEAKQRASSNRHDKHKGKNSFGEPPASPPISTTSTYKTTSAADSSDNFSRTAQPPDRVPIGRAATVAPPPPAETPSAYSGVVKKFRAKDDNAPPPPPTPVAPIISPPTKKVVSNPAKMYQPTDDTASMTERLLKAKQRAIEERKQDKKD